MPLQDFQKSQTSCPFSWYQIIILLTKNIIKVKPEKKELGFVGSPKEIDLKGILKIIKEKKIPIVVPMGTSDDKKTYNINADIAAGSVAKELNSRRLLLMTDVQGVLDKDKKLISGDPEKVKKVYDTWKFSKNMWSSNPNWILTETEI